MGRALSLARRHGAGIAFDLKVYLSGYSSAKQLDWGCANFLVNALSQLATFAVWSDDNTGLASALTSVKNRFNSTEDARSNREKI